MKKILKIIGIIFMVIALVIGGFALIMGNGLEATRRLTICKIDTSVVTDGTYEGVYNGGRFTNKVAVTVKNGKIAGIEVLQTVTFEKTDVTQRLIGGVIERQNTDVDAISGATITSKAYLKAIENALVQK